MKKILSVLLCVVLLGGLIGCSGSNNGSQSGDTASLQRRIADLEKEVERLEDENAVLRSGGTIPSGNNNTSDSKTDGANVIRSGEFFVCGNYFYYKEETDWMASSDPSGNPAWSTSEYSIMRVNLSNGEKEILATSRRFSEIMVSNDVLYYSSDADNDSSIFKIDLNTRPYTPVFISYGRLDDYFLVNNRYIAEFSNSGCRTLDLLRNEKIEFAFTISGLGERSSSDRIYYAVKNNSEYYSLQSTDFSGADLTILSPEQLGFSITYYRAPVYADGYFFIWLETKEFGRGLYRIDLETMGIVKLAELVNSEGVLAATKGNVYWIERDGSLYSMSYDGKTRTVLYDGLSANLYGDTRRNESASETGLCLYSGNTDKYIFFDWDYPSAKTITIDRNKRPETPPSP